MNQIIIAVIGLVGAIFASQGFWTFMQNRSRKKSDESKLMMGIGYSKIIDLCEKHIENGFLTTSEFHELEHYLYNPYRAMGGNGTVENLFNKVCTLDIIPDKEAKKNE